ncbi:hypothetical protein [Isoptericola sp. NPDC056618]|uniref:hypothetical protein n=1 Tax=unclassified Isoptericola TaxID=2623355 RepID=UPI003658069B
MALIVLTSANGSPGVTTSALALALSWPRPVVLVDADPTGARAVPAGYFGGAQMPTDTTVVDLAVSHRHGTLAEDLPRALMSFPDSQVQYLAGAMNHQQSRALDELWEPLSAVFRSLEGNGQDVIVDAGRLGLVGSPTKLLTQADLALLTTHSSLPALVAASSWAQSLRDAFTGVGAIESLGALVVGPGRPYGGGEVAKVLRVPVVAGLDWDPASAEVYALGAKRPKKFSSSGLNKSVRAAVQSIGSSVARSRQQLALGAERSAL